MQEDQYVTKRPLNAKKSSDDNELHLKEALVPVLFLMGLLVYNIFFAEGKWLGDYSNQFILLIGALVASIIGFLNGVSLKRMINEVIENFKNVFIPIIILCFVGALAGTWLVSGITPAMVYYGLQVLIPNIFLPTAVIISAIVSIATGSSWTTSATVGFALIGIGNALGIPSSMIAGAVISGAYFGDKMSPLSDTTNLAPAMAGTNLFTHIKYMAYTTIPTITVTLLIFMMLSSAIKTTGNTDISNLLKAIDHSFTISLWLFIVPAIVVLMILMKVKPLIALGSGITLAGVFAYIFQPDVLATLSESKIQSIIQAIFTDTQIKTSNEKLTELFSAGGIKGMIWTILLVLCAMVFGGIMDAIGALARITKALLSLATTILGLFVSTMMSCLGLNIIASDQYLAIVIPGKMFKKAFEDKKLAPENLSRTLEDSGTVTSVLIPWNTCGAYQSGVLGVEVTEYALFAIFNWLSPLMTFLFAVFKIKIKALTTKT